MGSSQERQRPRPPPLDSPINRSATRASRPVHFRKEQYEEGHSDYESEMYDLDLDSQMNPMRAENAGPRPGYHPSAQDPTGDSNKAMTTATTATSATAMSSNTELRLYRMDACGPTCPRMCASCQPRWSSLPSLEAERRHIAEMENGHGIVTRIDPTRDNKTVQVNIQNKHMKDILTRTFDGYPDFHPSLLPEDSAWVFNEPFDMFVGRWDSLREYKLRTPFDAEKEAWVALVAAMTPVIQPTLDSIKRIKDTGLVLWKDLPLIFPAGKLIIVEQSGAIQSVARVQKGKSTPGNYQLYYECIDWDGEIYGLTTGSLDIHQYAGYKKVRMSGLKTMPLDFCPSEEELRAKLIARGRRWGSVPIEVSACHCHLGSAYTLQLGLLTIAGGHRRVEE